MYTNEQTFDLLSFRIKSERRKKRLQKKDFEKKLLQLDKQQSRLWKERYKLPMIPLEKPYQKGWKRFFVLTEEVKRSKDAAFYQALLDKINTTHYSNNKRFILKFRRKDRKVHTRHSQGLREFYEREWHSLKSAFSEKERALFYRNESWSNKTKAVTVKYVFMEPWRFVLQIKPHMITEVKMVDGLLEQDYQALENYISTHDLLNKMIKLKRGKVNYKSAGFTYPILKQGEPIRKLSLHRLLEQCSE